LLLQVLPCPTAKRWWDDGHGYRHTAVANSAVIVRLDRTIQYSVGFRFYFDRSPRLDPLFRGYDDKGGRDEQEIDRKLK
jgi:hypothetical protein